MDNHKCLHCGKEYQTNIEDYHYLESGLDNFWIREIEVYRCDCGESAAIPQPLAISKEIAKCLIIKTTPLTGKEIRFLRKHMTMKAIEFAKRIGVDNATVSRWENEKDPHSPIADRFIRLSCAVEMGYIDEVKQLLNEIFPEITPANPSTHFYISADQLGRLSCSQACR